VNRTIASETKLRPNIVLIMTDDQGWGETGYHGHPHLKTPTLDEMAAKGLRLDRFYAAAPVCSPTRTAVLTGRNPVRSGSFGPNYSTRPEEITIAQILKSAGYRTGHFGKWHVGPVKAASPLNPARMGFDEYLSHDNFFDIDPLLSHNGAPPEIIKGESSEVVVDAATKFIKQVHIEGKPFFMIVWFGSPHGPYHGLTNDVALYDKVTGEETKNRFAEITAMDRAVGKFRNSLKELDVANNTLVWFTSDNGIPTASVPVPQRAALFNGGWRDGKWSLYEGGLRVPGIIEWPAVIQKPRTSTLPCVSSDIFPTLLELLELKSPDPQRPLDGVSLRKLIVGEEMTARPQPIGFWNYEGKPEKKNARWIDEELSRGTTHLKRDGPVVFSNYHHPVARTNNFNGEVTWTDNRFKLFVSHRPKSTTTRLFDLLEDPRETKNVANQHPDIVKTMTAQLEEWQRSVERSLTGADYSK
jgi:arylsulfatase A-like enzyme